MVFPILGANTESAAYEIENSLRFNDGDSPYLNRTFATPTNRKKFTFSAWYKRSTLSTTQYIISYDSGGLSMGIIGFGSNDKFIIYDRDSSSGSADIDYNTTQLFRDVSAWYHIVVSIDTTDGTSGDRVKIYVNGTRVTSFDTSTTPAQDYDTIMNSAVSHDIGRWQAGSSYYDGYMSEINYVDGQALDSSYFGETNDNGVWVPIKYTGSYGTNGFHLEFKQTGTSANSSGMGADTSGNDNHFTPNNLAATDVTTDTPTNNFATLNPIDKAGNGAITFSEGNLKAAVEDNGNARGNFFVNSGKWYWETLIVSGDSVATVGIAEPGFYSGNLFDSSSTAKGYIYINNGQKRSTSGTSSYGASYSNDDIIGVALNMDDGEVTFYKNNSTQSVAFSSLSGDHGIYYQGYGGTATVILNTGQDSSFAGNKTAQNNTDGNGYGDFYYSPPSGFYALNTKNLAEFG